MQDRYTRDSRLLFSLIAAFPHLGSHRTSTCHAFLILKFEQKRLKVVSASLKASAHQWLILHGHYSCVAGKPRCGSCIIEDLCEIKNKIE
ncbi:hypothetical protein [Paraglaciecola algarum]|uniref:hypothetical protein n=1 Tax=Paraglaciecola algarum TaxID=3050085 RepID=UPI00351D83DC